MRFYCFAQIKSSVKVLAVIPARYASTRLPGKPLAMIGGKPMIQHVYERARQVKAITRLIVATDDERIETAVKGFGGEVMMTAESCRNGTERCAEVLAKLNESFDVLLNIQGDEPFVSPEQLHALIAPINEEACKIVTLKKQIDSKDEVHNPSVVKVVTSQNGNALYFSRSAIPFVRHADHGHTFYKHIGLYAFRASIIPLLVRLPESVFERTEQLEQLRWMDNSIPIRVVETTIDSVSVDTPQDLEKAQQIFEAMHTST